MMWPAKVYERDRTRIQYFLLIYSKVDLYFNEMNSYFICFLDPFLVPYPPSISRSISFPNLALQFKDIPNSIKQFYFVCYNSCWVFFANSIPRLSYFNEVHGVIYIASLGGYNLMLEEDPSENRMIESIKLFYILASSSYFARTPFILFLNKTDLFR